MITCRRDRDDAGAHFQSQLVAAEAQRAAHVRRTQRGMTGEWHFVRGREDADQRGGALRRQDEGGFRQVELARKRLHGGGIERAAIFDDGQRVARQACAAGREHVENAVAEFHGEGLFHNPCVRYPRETLETPSNCTDRLRSNADEVFSLLFLVHRLGVPER